MPDWLILIAFVTCAGCQPDTILAPAEPAWCLSSLARWEAGEPDTQTLLIEEGDDKGKRYPVTGVWCLEPDDQAVNASYPLRETP